MRKYICFCLLVVSVAFTISSCRYDRVYYYNKTGHYRSARAHRAIPWFNAGEKGYNKKARRVIRQWDRNFR